MQIRTYQFIYFKGKKIKINFSNNGLDPINSSDMFYYKSVQANVPA